MPRPFSWCRFARLGAGVLAALGLAAPVTGLAATAPLPPVLERTLAQDYSVRAWHRPDGLPAERVTALAATRDGYLWIGTPAGLARFDGLRFVRFDKANSPALANNSVLRIAEDAGTGLWIATDDSQVVVRTPRGWFQPHLGESRPRYSFVLRTSETGRVWMQSQTGWVRAPRSPDPAAVPPAPSWESADPSSRGAGDILESADGDTCLVGPASVTLVDAQGRPRVKHPLPAIESPHLTSAAIARDRDGSYWFTYGQFTSEQPLRLYRLTPESLALVDEGITNYPPPAFLTRDPRQGFWYPQGGGRLAHTTAQARTRYRLPAGAESDRALAIETTVDGSLWVGLEAGGLIQLRPKRSRAVQLADGLPHAQVRAVIPWEPGVLAAGTEDGVARIRTDGPDPATGRVAEPLGPPGASVRALARDARGRLWAGTARGLYALRDGQWVPQALPRVLLGISDSDALGSRKIRDLRVTRSGDLWVATAHQVVVIPADQSAPRLVAALPDSVPTCLLEDRDGNLWLGTDRGGLGVVGADRLRRLAEFPVIPELTTQHDRWIVPPAARITTTNGLASDQAWQLHEDSQGRLWIASDRGLQRFPAAAVRLLAAGAPLPGGPGHQPFLFTTHHGLPELAINAFVEDATHDFWLGAEHGVFRVAASDYDRVASGEVQHLAPEVFGEIDGLPASETSGRVSHPGACTDDQDQVWFATVAGLARLNRLEAGTAPSPPQAALEQVRADGRILASSLPADPEGGFQADTRDPATPDAPMPSPAARTPSRLPPGVDPPIRLAPGHGRVLEFRFTGLDFADPGSLRFRYQLEGYEEQPHDAGTRREAYYTNLSPGDYRFRVWAANRHGQWSTRPAEFPFHLTPFVWQTLWFQLAAVAFGLGVVAAGVAWRIDQIRRLERLRRRAEQAELRTRLARDLHDGVGSGIARLALLTHAPPTEPLSPEAAVRRFRDLSAAIRDLADTVREVSWNASPESLSLEELAARVAHQANEYLGAAGVRCRTSLPLEFPDLQLPPEQRSSLYFAAREAVTNLVRHAHATEARLTIELTGEEFRLTLTDNGRGLPEEVLRGDPTPSPSVRGPASHGNGLRNLRARVEALGGRLHLTQAHGQGTSVAFHIPLRNLGPGGGAGPGSRREPESAS